MTKKPLIDENGEKVLNDKKEQVHVDNYLKALDEDRKLPKEVKYHDHNGNIRTDMIVKG
tara:strand:+ start:2230 stop:2406 length:177 start_codon:yes stop_codon:yes gene_type:complete